jgi:hypothetical protein
MDVDAIAAQFVPDGELGGVAKGRDSIRNFLKGFAAYKVLSNHSITDSVWMNGDTAMQKGNYAQVTILPTKDTVHLKGEFTARWLRRSKEEWLIQRMDTRPR